MQCLYCDSQIDPYPPSGICPNCGAKLSRQEEYCFKCKSIIPAEPDELEEHVE